MILTLIAISKFEMGPTEGSFLLNSHLSGHIDAFDGALLGVGLRTLLLLVEEHIGKISLVGLALAVI